ncbi:50S ribosomal protein L7/L12 [Candidatus Phytoplasma phoenicium]|uniref:Large ribosomal subunit protein bL12 n=1 Tax=Candidatus Phytoplasma phoenicium TaxID=198422 RepID=A0A0L0MJH4_9MOLU|nr:50S ribosomal protein L7/L12 [Candidatus Phytoplasma phoenicium]KND62498.1 50S ribosomal protein L7/L12 [Candidatus Phytoplasma phoenicium]
MTKLNKEVFIEALKGMTLLEIKELVEGLKEEFGIDLSNSSLANTVSGNNANSNDGAEEQTEFKLILKTFGDVKNKIPVMRALRDLYNFTLQDVKQLIETPDTIIKEGISKQEAQRAKEQLESLGASVELK